MTREGTGTPLLTPEEIATRLEHQLQAARAAVEDRPSLVEEFDRAVADETKLIVDKIDEQLYPKYRFIRPLADAATGLIEVLQNTEGRYMTGLREIDLCTRGFGRKELIMFTGYVHSGKTQLWLTSIINNRDKRIVMFTPDEPAELVLTKLICMRTRSNAERLEERIKANDAEAIARVRKIASEDFANLLIIDDHLGLGEMSQAMEEAERYFGGPVDATCLDYLKQYKSDAPTVEDRANELKAWAKDHDVPLVVIHQGSRGKVAKGEPIEMDSGAYGGEAEAIIIIGVRRKQFDESLEDWERLAHHDTITLSVVKNKRPPSRRTPREGIDFFMHADSGLILPLSHRGVEAASTTAGAQPADPQRVAWIEQTFDVAGEL